MNAQTTQMNFDVPSIFKAKGRGKPLGYNYLPKKFKDETVRDFIKEISNKRHPEKIVQTLINEVWKQLVKHEGNSHEKTKQEKPKITIKKVTEKQRNYLTTAEKYKVDIKYYINAKYYSLAQHAAVKGTKVCDRKDFYTWCITDKKFVKKFETWKKHQNIRKLAPVIKRIDPLGDYTIGNLTLA